MTLFLHLLRHDLHTHRTLLLVWLGILALHPLATWLLTWLDPTAPSAYVTTGVLVTLARVASVAIIVGVLVQTDGPSAEAAFWRTRPVPARVLATQKLTMVYTVFLVLPAAMVMATAIVAGVPVGDLGWMLRQVVLADALFVGACVVAAAVTTRPSTALLTLLLGAIVVWFGSVGIAGVTSQLGITGRLSLTGVTLPVLAFTVLSLVALLLAAAAWRLYLVGPARRVHVTAAAVAIVVVLAFATRVVLPGRDARQRSGDAAIDLALDRSRLLVETVVREGVTQVVMSAPPVVSGLRSDERAQVWAHDATFHTPEGGMVVARTERSLRATDFTKAGLDRWPAVAVLDPAEIEALRGLPLDYTGSFTVEVLRRESLGRAPFAAGARLTAGPYRLRIDAVERAATPGEFALAEVTVLQMTPYFPAYTWSRPEWHLVDRPSDRRELLYLTSAPSPPSFHTLLPTLAPPFIWATMQLRRARATADVSNVAPSAELEVTGVGRPRLIRREVRIDGLQIPSD